MTMQISDKARRTARELAFSYHGLLTAFEVKHAGAIRKHGERLMLAQQALGTVLIPPTIIELWMGLHEEEERQQ